MNRISFALTSFLVAALCCWLLLTVLGETGSRTVGGSAQIVELQEPKQASSNGTSAGSNSAFPVLIGRINDYAAMLDPSQKADLDKRLAEFETRSSDQLVIATLVTLDGNNLEDYANRLFRHWQLGQAGENNGVLLLIVRDDRKMRIEVGYGLEGTLTDALSRLIIEQVIVPKFRAGAFGSGIVEGTDMILRVLSGDVAELEARKERSQDRSVDDFDIELWIFILVWGVLFFGPVAFSILAAMFGKKIGKGRFRWLGMEVSTSGSSRVGSSGGGSSGGSGWSSGSSGGGFSGGGGSSGGGGASGGW